MPPRSCAHPPAGRPRCPDDALVTETRWSVEPSQSWGSGGHRHWRVWVVGRQEFLPETGAERAVVEGAADLEQQIGPAPGPAHLLRPLPAPARFYLFRHPK